MGGCCYWKKKRTKQWWGGVVWLDLQLPQEIDNLTTKEYLEMFYSFHTKAILAIFMITEHFWSIYNYNWCCNKTACYQDFPVKKTWKNIFT